MSNQQSILEQAMAESKENTPSNDSRRFVRTPRQEEEWATQDPTKEQLEFLTKKGKYSEAQVAKLTSRLMASRLMDVVYAKWEARDAQPVSDAQLAVLLKCNVTELTARQFTHGMFNKFLAKRKKDRADAKAAREAKAEAATLADAMAEIGEPDAVSDDATAPLTEDSPLNLDAIGEPEG